MTEKNTVKSVLSRILSEREYREYSRSRRRAFIALVTVLPWFLGYTLLLASLSLLSNILGFTSLIASNIVILFYFARYSRRADRYDERVIGKPSRKENTTAGIAYLLIVLSVLSLGLSPLNPLLARFSVFLSLVIAFIFIAVNINLFMQRKRKALRSWAMKLG